MYDLHAVTDFISRGAELYRHYVPTEWNTYPNAVAAAAVIVGAALAFWGARLLRTMYVLGFMAGGAAIGFQLGRYFQIDPLIGLTFGGGIAGFIGFFFYRWWVGTTAGAFAVIVVLLVAWPRIMEVEQEYQDHAAGVGTGTYVLATGANPQSPEAYLAGFAEFLWKDRKDFGGRLVFAAGLAWMLGMVMGLLLPRFTIILGTSVFGMLFLAGGCGVLLWRYAPEFWSRLVSHPDWYLAAAALVLLVSAFKQAWPGKLKLPAPAAPAASPAPTTK